MSKTIQLPTKRSICKKIYLFFWFMCGCFLKSVGIYLFMLDLYCHILKHFTYLWNKNSGLREDLRGEGNRVASVTLFTFTLKLGAHADTACVKLGPHADIADTACVKLGSHAHTACVKPLPPCWHSLQIPLCRVVHALLLCSLPVTAFAMQWSLD